MTAEYEKIKRYLYWINLIDFHSTESYKNKPAELHVVSTILCLNCQ